VTGNPAASVVAVVATVVVVAGPEVVVAVVVVVAAVLPQAEIATDMANARKGILLKRTSSLSEDEGVGRFGNRTISPSSETLRVCRRGRRPGSPIRRIRIVDSCPGRA
jgi:hypothetical protein